VGRRFGVLVGYELALESENPVFPNDSRFYVVSCCDDMVSDWGRPVVKQEIALFSSWLDYLISGRSYIGLVLIAS
jgi:hypothetical protein